MGGGKRCIELVRKEEEGGRGREREGEGGRTGYFGVQEYEVMDGAMEGSKRRI